MHDKLKESRRTVLCEKLGTDKQAWARWAKEEHIRSFERRFAMRESWLED